MPRELAVYLHTELEPRQLSRSLERELPGWSVVVFGRRRDFERRVKRKPDAVLALGPVLASVGIQPSVQGLRGGKKQEPYVLMSRKSVAPSSLRAIGTVDLFGRRDTADFVKAKTKANARVELVSKIVDLVALLRFGKAEAVLLPSRLSSSARRVTEMGLVVTKLPGVQLGLPAFSSAKGEIRSLATGFSKQLNSQLGVSSWS